MASQEDDSKHLFSQYVKSSTSASSAEDKFIRLNFLGGKSERDRQKKRENLKQHSHSQGTLKLLNISC